MDSESTYVYGMSIYNEEHGFSGVNVFQLYSTFERACLEVDLYIERNCGYDIELPPINIEEVKKKMNGNNYVPYRVDDDNEEDVKTVYAIVKLKIN
jgi:hypothetical protein